MIEVEVLETTTTEPPGRVVVDGITEREVVGGNVLVEEAESLEELGGGLEELEDEEELPLLGAFEQVVL